MLDMRPHDGDEGKSITFDSEEMNLATTDALLTTLADVVCHASLSSEQCLWLLYGIGKLRGQVYRDAPRIRVEAKGRQN